MIYRRGLKFNIKEELMRTRVQINNLDTLIVEAIKVDDKLYELIIEKRYNSRTSGIG